MLPENDYSSLTTIISWPLASGKGVARSTRILDLCNLPDIPAPLPFFADAYICLQLYSRYLGSTRSALHIPFDIASSLRLLLPAQAACRVDALPWSLLLNYHGTSQISLSQGQSPFFSFLPRNKDHWVAGNSVFQRLSQLRMLMTYVWSFHSSHSIIPQVTALKHYED